MRVVTLADGSIVVFGDTDLSDEQMAQLLIEASAKRSTLIRDVARQVIADLPANAPMVNVVASEPGERARFAPAWLAITIGLFLVILGLIVVPVFRIWTNTSSDVLDNIALFLVGAGAVLIGAATGRGSRH